MNDFLHFWTNLNFKDTSSYSFESSSGRDTINAAKHLAAARRTFQLTSSSSVYSFALSLQQI